MKSLDGSTPHTHAHPEMDPKKVQRNTPGGPQLGKALLALGVATGAFAPDSAAEDKKSAHARTARPGISKPFTPQKPMEDGDALLLKKRKEASSPPAPQPVEKIDDEYVGLLRYIQALNRTDITGPDQFFLWFMRQGEGGMRPRVPEMEERWRSSMYKIEMTDHKKRPVFRMNLGRGGESFSTTAVRVGQDRVLTSAFSYSRLSLGKNRPTDEEILRSLPPNGINLTVRPTIPALKGRHAEAPILSAIPTVPDKDVARGTYATAVGEREIGLGEDIRNYDTNSGTFFLSGMLMPPSEGVIRDLVLRQLMNNTTINNKELREWIIKLVAHSHFFIGDKSEARNMVQSTSSATPCLPIYAAVRGTNTLQHMGYISEGPILVTRDGSKVTFDERGKADKDFVPVYLVQGQKRVQEALGNQ